jgi:hypothetical protein
MATVSVTVADSKINKIARGIDPEAYDANPPSNVAEAEALVEAWMITHMKVAFRRGDKLTYADGFTPEPDPEPEPAI